MYDLFWFPVLEGYISFERAEKMYEHELIELSLAIKHHHRE
ncbi:hypothetical protein [Tissierella praeacuta]